MASFTLKGFTTYVLYILTVPRGVKNKRNTKKNALRQSVSSLNLVSEGLEVSGLPLFLGYVPTFSVPFFF